MTAILPEKRITSMSDGSFRLYRKAAISRYRAYLDRVYPTCGCNPPCYRERNKSEFATDLDRQMLAIWDGIRVIVNRELVRREKAGSQIRGSKRNRKKKS